MTRALVLFLASAIVGPVAAAPRPITEVATEAARFAILVDLPQFETTAQELELTQRETLARASDAVEAIARQTPEHVTFESTFGALDRINREVGDAAQRIALIRATHAEPAVRETAAAAAVEMSNWWVALEYHPGLYRSLKAFADRSESLSGQARRFIDEVMRDYRRAGLHLPENERLAVEQIRKELNELTNQFDVNIAEAQLSLSFSEAELDGMPATFFDSPGVRQPDGQCIVRPNVTWQALAVFENCRVAATRERVFTARGQLAKTENEPVLARMVARRAELARRLGYATWADYRTEIQMAGSAAAALAFERRLVAGLEQKFQAEKTLLRQLKAAEIGDANAELKAWDVSYYLNQLKSQTYAVDTEALRVYFPYETTLTGMFRLYEHLFGLSFSEIEPPYRWAEGVSLHLVSDRASGEPLGFFYLDMFPRDGKYNHFACFPIRTGGPADGARYALPIVSLVCNFPPATAETPSLLKHDDVITLFHEFGHVMHALLGRSQFHRLSAFSVPQDFVEAPSQMLENWVWDKAVLDTFAADYRDPTRKVPASTIRALQAARIATAGTFYRRQLSFGLVDLTLHTLPPSDVVPEVVALSNAVIEKVTYPPPPDTSFATYFGHLSGYDAAYYGYLWSLAIATDLASVFRSAPDGFLDQAVGQRLRREIYTAAATRDVHESIEQFLGRPRSLDAFLEYVGVNASSAARSP